MGMAHKCSLGASSRSAPRTTSVASLYTFGPQEFFGRPLRCGCSTIHGGRAWPESAHCLLTSVKGRAAIFPKRSGDKSKCWKFLGGRFALTQFCLRSSSHRSAGCWGFLWNILIEKHWVFSIRLHAVCKQYNNFDITQASNIWICSDFRRTAWFQTRDNVSNSALAAKRCLFSSSPILPLSHKKFPK